MKAFREEIEKSAAKIPVKPGGFGESLRNLWSPSRKWIPEAKKPLMEAEGKAISGAEAAYKKGLRPIERMGTKQQKAYAGAQRQYGSLQRRGEKLQRNLTQAEGFRKGTQTIGAQRKLDKAQRAYTQHEATQMYHQRDVLPQYRTQASEAQRAMGSAKGRLAIQKQQAVRQARGKTKQELAGLEEQGRSMDFKRRAGIIGGGVAAVGGGAALIGSMRNRNAAYQPMY